MTDAELKALHLASISGPRCPREECEGVVAPGRLGLRCLSCGLDFAGTPDQREQAKRASDAHDRWSKAVGP